MPDAARDINGHEAPETMRPRAHNKFLTDTAFIRQLISAHYLRDERFQTVGKSFEKWAFT